MSGYDDLNGGLHFGINLSPQGNLTVTDGLCDWPVDALSRFDPCHYAWLVVIYFSLTAYITNDANKVVEAYGRALYYYNAYVEPHVDVQTK